MKKHYNLILIAFVAMMAITACKKEEEPATEEIITTNVPPSSGDFMMVSLYNSGSGQFEVRWTQDYENFKLYNSSLGNTSSVHRNGDTVLIISANAKTIHYGSVYKPDKLKKVTSNRIISDVAMINGVLVALSIDVNNYYRGYCDVKNGETSFNFILLPGGTQYQNLSYVNHAVISYINIGGSGVMGYTRNGKHWTITSGPFTTNADYFYEENKTIARNSWDTYVTTDTAYSSATWESIEHDINTTDTIGTFTSYYIKRIPYKWAYYGILHSNVTGNDYPAVNISNDGGQNFTTTLLEGIPTITNNNLMILSIENTGILISYHIGGGVYRVYTSDDGIEFTENGSFTTHEISALSNGAYFPEE